MRFRRAQLVTVALAAVGCGADVVTGPSAVAGVTWRLHSLQRDDFSVVPVEQPERYTVAFGDDGHLAVRADCNRCAGSYSLEGDAFAPGLLACTRAACPPDSLDAEFLRILAPGGTLGVREDVLQIRTPEGVLRFAP